MGILDGIKQRANQAINTVGSGINEAKKTAESAVNTVQKTAESAVNTVESGVKEVKKTATQAADTLINTAEQARDRVTQTMDQGVKQVQQAIDHPFETVNRAADRLGGEVRNGGKLLEQGGKQLEGIIPFADEITQLGRNAQTVGRGIQDAPEAAAAGADQVVRTVDQLGQDAQNLYNRAEQAVDRGIAQGQEVAREGLQMVRDGITGITNAGKEFVTDVATAVDYNKQIDQLGPGDKYTLGIGADGSVEGAKLYAKGQIEVERKGNQYVVSVDGELGGGLYAEIGGKVGAKASGSAEALLGVGGKVEMSFNSPEEAQRATEILLRQAAASGAGGAASNVPLVGPLAGIATNAVLAPSAQDMQFLADRTSAVEFRGNLAAGIAGTLGVANKHTRLAGVFGKAGVKEELTARLEFGRGGQNPSITFKGELSGELALGAGIGLSGTSGNKDGAATGLGVGVNGTAKISHEQRFELPNNIDTNQLMQNPLNTLGGIADQIGKSKQDKVSVTLQGEADLAGNDAGFKAQLDFTGKTEDIIQSGALQRAVQGDLGGALRATGDQIQVDAAITPYRTHGISLSPSVSIMGFGVGVEGKALRQDFADKPMWEYHGTASQAADAIQPQLDRAMRFVQEHPELIQARTGQMAFPLRG